MDLTERLAWLERAELFAPLCPECLARVALAAEEESAPAGQTLYAPGEPAHGLYLLCEGAVALELAGRAYRVAPGECFGFEEVLTGGGRRHGARTASPCRLLTLGRGEVLGLLAEDPGLALGAVGALLSRQLRAEPEGGA